MSGHFRQLPPDVLLGVIVDVVVEPDDGRRHEDVEQEIADQDLDGEVFRPRDQPRHDKVRRDVEEEGGRDGGRDWLRPVRVGLGVVRRRFPDLALHEDLHDQVGESHDGVNCWMNDFSLWT